MELLAAGLTGEEIAERLVLSVALLDRMPDELLRRIAPSLVARLEAGQLGSDALFAALEDFAGASAEREAAVR